MEDLVTPPCKRQSTNVMLLDQHVLTSALGAPQGYWSSLQWAQGFPALRSCKCASLIFSLGAKPQRAKKWRQPKLDDDWMITWWYNTKPTSMKPNKHHQPVPAIHYSSVCDSRHSEVPDCWQIIPNRTKGTLLSDTLTLSQTLVTVQVLIINGKKWAVAIL